MFESSRQQWDEAERRLGSAYTVEELDALDLVSADWIRDAVEDGLPTRPRVALGDAALVQDAAFGAYARGAVDYRP